MEKCCIDKKATKKGVRELLSRYRYFSRMMKLSVNGNDFLKSKAVSDMPSYRLNENVYESILVNTIDELAEKEKEAIEYLKSIDHTLAALPNISKFILYYTYCENEKYTMNEIAAKLVVIKKNKYGQDEEVQYSVKNIERLKNIALLEFAEIYEHGVLIAEYERSC